MNFPYALVIFAAHVVLCLPAANAPALDRANLGEALLALGGGAQALPAAVPPRLAESPDGATLRLGGSRREDLAALARQLGIALRDVGDHVVAAAVDPALDLAAKNAQTKLAGASDETERLVALEALADLADRGCDLAREVLVRAYLDAGTRSVAQNVLLSRLRHIPKWPTISPFADLPGDLIDALRPIAEAACDGELQEPVPAVSIAAVAGAAWLAQPLDRIIDRHLDLTPTTQSSSANLRQASLTESHLAQHLAMRALLARRIGDADTLARNWATRLTDAPLGAHATTLIAGLDYLPDAEATTALLAPLRDPTAWTTQTISRACNALERRMDPEIDTVLAEIIAKPPEDRFLWLLYSAAHAANGRPSCARVATRILAGTPAPAPGPKQAYLLILRNLRDPQIIHELLPLLADTDSKALLERQQLICGDADAVATALERLDRILAEPSAPLGNLIEILPTLAAIRRTPFGDRLVPAVQRRDLQDALHRACISALPATRDRRAAETLRTLLASDSAAGIRAAALTSLASLPGADDSTNERYLDDAEPALRAAALASMTRFGVRSSSSGLLVPHIAKALADPVLDVRRAALNAVIFLRPTDTSAPLDLAPLMTALDAAIACETDTAFKNQLEFRHRFLEHRMNRPQGPATNPPSASGSF